MNVCTIVAIVSWYFFLSDYDYILDGVDKQELFYVFVH